MIIPRGEFFSGVRFKTHRNRPPNSQVKTCAFQNAPVRLPLKNSPLEGDSLHGHLAFAYRSIRDQTFRVSDI